MKRSYLWRDQHDSITVVRNGTVHYASNCFAPIKSCQYVGPQICPVTKSLRQSLLPKLRNRSGYESLYAWCTCILCPNDHVFGNIISMPMLWKYLIERPGDPVSPRTNSIWRTRKMLKNLWFVECTTIQKLSISKKFSCSCVWGSE